MKGLLNSSGQLYNHKHIPHKGDYFSDALALAETESRILPSQYRILDGSACLRMEVCWNFCRRTKEGGLREKDFYRRQTL